MKTKGNQGNTIHPERLPIAYDFSREDVVNDHSLNRSTIEQGFISFNNTEKEVRPVMDKIQLGSFIPQKSLQKILHRQDSSIYSVYRSIKKTSKEKQEIAKAFELLLDFFSPQIVQEVRNYVEKSLKKIKQKYKEEFKEKSFTPRKRRAMVLAVFGTICRKNGRKFTQYLLDEINERFSYTRTIKMKEIVAWESRLYTYKLMLKTVDLTKETIQNFYHHLVKRINYLREDVEFCSGKYNLVILEAAKKLLFQYGANKANQLALRKICKHNDVDFLSRIILWSVAKHLAKEIYRLEFKDASKLKGWKKLFWIESNSNSTHIPIRSYKYTFWMGFKIRTMLQQKRLL